ncbi:MAG: hypothetical protein HYU99_04865 [Deltaproteobacteria bacterium]|nr:hypothetical protein [Deltaproteobacteria bacterium]
MANFLMRKVVIFFLVISPLAGFVSCGNDATAESDQQDPDEGEGDGGGGGSDEDPSIDEEEPSGSDTDDGITGDDEDVDIETPDIDEGDDEGGEEEVVTVSPEIVSFEAGEECVKPNTRVTLSWETENAAEVYLGNEAVETSGRKKVRPFFETTYTLTALNGDETDSATVSIYFKEASVAYETDEESFGGGEIDAVSSSDDGTLLVLAEGKVYKGKFGDDFSKLTPNSSVSKWSAVNIDPTDSDILYAGTTGRIYRSSNGGSSWPDVVPVRRNNVDLDLNVIYTSPANPDLVYIGFEGGVFVLDTDRQTLELASDLNTESIRHFAADQDCVVAATKSGIFMSFNEGDSWREKDAAGWGEIHSLDIFNGVLYVSAEKGLYYAETDTLSNPSWEKEEGLDGPVYQALARQEPIFMGGVGGLVRFAASSFFEPWVIYAATEDGVYRGSNGEWEEVSADPAYWIIEDEDPVSVSDSALTSVEQTIVYSDECPNQPSIHTISADPVKFPL